jgi:hypothetical protein
MRRKRLKKTTNIRIIPEIIRIRQGKKFRIHNTDVDVVQYVVAEVAEAVGES